MIPRDITLAKINTNEYLLCQFKEVMLLIVLSRGFLKCWKHSKWLTAHTSSEEFTCRLLMPQHNELLLTPWCLYFWDHHTHTMKLTHSLVWCCSQYTHPSSMESLRVTKSAFGTSRKTLGRQLSSLYVEVPVAASCCHLHKHNPLGRENWCCFAG